MANVGRERDDHENRHELLRSQAEPPGAHQVVARRYPRNEDTQEFREGYGHGGNGSRLDNEE